MRIDVALTFAAVAATAIHYGLIEAGPVLRSTSPSKQATPGSAGAAARVVPGQNNDPSQLQCDPGTGLHVVGLTPLSGNESNPYPVLFERNKGCKYLDDVKRRIVKKCNGLQQCVVDMSEIQATKEHCVRVKFVSIDVYCQPIGHRKMKKPNKSGSKHINESAKKLHHTMSRQSSHKKLRARIKSNKKQKLVKKGKRPGKKRKRPGKKRKPGMKRRPVKKRKRPVKKRKPGKKKRPVKKRKRPVKKRKPGKKKRPVKKRKRPGKRRPGIGNSVRTGISRNAMRRGKSSVDILDTHQNRSPQVHCSKSVDGSSGTFMCRQKGRLPPSMLDAIQDDSYIIVTGTKSNRKKLVIIQREGRMLTRDILLNILESNDIIRNAEARMKSSSSRSRSKTFAMKSKKSFANAGDKKSEKINLHRNRRLHKHKQFGKKRLHTYKSASQLNARRRGKKNHKFRKMSKLSNKKHKRLLSRAGKKKTLHPSPKKTVTLEIKLEVNEKPTSKKGHGTSKSARRKSTKVVSKGDEKVSGRLKNSDLKSIEAKQNLSDIEYWKNYRTTKYKSITRVRRSRQGSEPKDENTGIEAFLGPDSITFGSPPIKFKSKNPKKILRTGKRKPNFKLDFVAEDKSAEQGSLSKQPGINAQVSLTNEDLQQLFDSLHHQENDLVSVKKHPPKIIGNDKPVITVSIHIGSLFPAELDSPTSVDNQQFEIKSKSRSRLRPNGIRRKQADKHSLNPFRKVAGRVSKGNNNQTSAIMELLPTNFEGQMSEIELQDFIKNIKTEYHKLSLAVKLLFLLHLTKKLGTNDSDILLHNGGHLPANIRQELEDADMFPSLIPHTKSYQLVQNTSEDRIMIHNSHHGKQYPSEVKTTKRLHIKKVGFGSKSLKNSKNKSRTHTELSKLIEEKAKLSSKFMENANVNFKPIRRKGKHKLKNKTYQEVELGQKSASSKKSHKAPKKKSKTLRFKDKKKTYHEAVGPDHKLISSVLSENKNTALTKDSESLSLSGKKKTYQAVERGHKSKVSNKMSGKGLRKHSKQYSVGVKKKSHHNGHKSLFSESNKGPNKSSKKGSYKNSFISKKTTYHKGNGPGRKSPSKLIASGEKHRKVLIAPEIEKSHEQESLLTSHTKFGDSLVTGHKEGNQRKPKPKGSKLYNKKHHKGKLFGGKKQNQIMRYDGFKPKEMKSPQGRQDERFNLSRKKNKNHLSSFKRQELLLNKHIDKGHGKDYTVHKKQDEGSNYIINKKVHQAEKHEHKTKFSKINKNKLTHPLKTVDKDQVNKFGKQLNQHYKPLSKNQVFGSSQISKSSKLTQRKHINSSKPFVKITDSRMGGGKPKPQKAVINKSKQPTFSNLSPKKLIKTNRNSMLNKPYKVFNQQQKEGPRKLVSHEKFTHLGKVASLKSSQPKFSRGKVAVTKGTSTYGGDYRSKPKVLKLPAATTRGKLNGLKKSDHKLKAKTPEIKHTKTLSKHKEHRLLPKTTSSHKVHHVQPKSKLGNSHKADSQVRNKLTIGKVANLKTGALQKHSVIKSRGKPALMKSPLHRQEEKLIVKANKAHVDRQNIGLNSKVNEVATDHKAPKLIPQSVGKIQKEHIRPKSALVLNAPEVHNSETNIAVKSKATMKADVKTLLASSPMSKERIKSKMERKKEVHGHTIKDNMHRKQNQKSHLFPPDKKLPTIQTQIKHKDIELKEHSKTNSLPEPSLASHHNSERHKSNIPLSKLEGKKEQQLKAEDEVPIIEVKKLQHVDSGLSALPGSKSGDEHTVKVTEKLSKLDGRKESKLRKKNEHLPDVEKPNSDHMKKHMKVAFVQDKLVKASKNIDKGSLKDSQLFSKFEDKKEVQLQKNEDKIKQLEHSDAIKLQHVNSGLSALPGSKTGDEHAVKVTEKLSKLDERKESKLRKKNEHLPDVEKPNSDHMKKHMKVALVQDKLVKASKDIDKSSSKDSQLFSKFEDKKEVQLQKNEDKIKQLEHSDAIKLHHVDSGLSALPGSKTGDEHTVKMTEKLSKLDGRKESKLRKKNEHLADVEKPNSDHSEKHMKVAFVQDKLVKASKDIDKSSLKDSQLFSKFEDKKEVQLQKNEDKIKQLEHSDAIKLQHVDSGLSALPGSKTGDEHAVKVTEKLSKLDERKESKLRKKNEHLPDVEKPNSDHMKKHMKVALVQDKLVKASKDIDKSSSKDSQLFSKFEDKKEVQLQKNEDKIKQLEHSDAIKLHLVDSGLSALPGSKTGDEHTVKMTENLSKLDGRKESKLRKKNEHLPDVEKPNSDHMKKHMKVAFVQDKLVKASKNIDKGSLKDSQLFSKFEDKKEVQLQKNEDKIKQLEHSDAIKLQHVDSGLSALPGSKTGDEHAVKVTEKLSKLDERKESKLRKKNEHLPDVEKPNSDHMKKHMKVALVQDKLVKASKDIDKSSSKDSQLFSKFEDKKEVQLQKNEDKIKQLEHSDAIKLHHVDSGLSALPGSKTGDEHTVKMTEKLSKLDGRKESKLRKKNEHLADVEKPNSDHSEKHMKVAFVQDKLVKASKDIDKSSLKDSQLFSKFEDKKEVQLQKNEDKIKQLEHSDAIKLQHVDSGLSALPGSKTGDEHAVKVTEKLSKLDERKESKLRKKNEHLADVEKPNSDHSEKHMKVAFVQDKLVKASKDIDKSSLKDSQLFSKFEDKNEVQLQKNEDKIKELEHSDAIKLQHVDSGLSALPGSKTGDEHTVKMTEKLSKLDERKESKLRKKNEHLPDVEKPNSDHMKKHMKVALVHDKLVNASKDIDKSSLKDSQLFSKFEDKNEVQLQKNEDKIKELEHSDAIKLQHVDSGLSALPGSKTGDEHTVKMTEKLSKLDERKESKLRKKNEHLPDVEKPNSDHMKKHMKVALVHDKLVNASKDIDKSSSKDSQLFSKFEDKKEVQLQKNEDKIKELEHSDAIMLVKTKSSPDSSVRKDNERLPDKSKITTKITDSSSVSDGEKKSQSMKLDGKLLGNEFKNSENVALKDTSLNLYDIARTSSVMKNSKLSSKSSKSAEAVKSGLGKDKHNFEGKESAKSLTLNEIHDKSNEQVELPLGVESSSTRDKNKVQTLEKVATEGEFKTYSEEEPHQKKTNILKEPQSELGKMENKPRPVIVKLSNDKKVKDTNEGLKSSSDKLVSIGKQSETAMKPFVADRAKTQLVVKTESKESPVLVKDTNEGLKSSSDNLVPIEKQSETAMKPFVADRAKTQLVVKTESKESPVLVKDTNEGLKSSSDKLVPIEKQSETAMKPFVADRAQTQLVVKTESKESPVLVKDTNEGLKSSSVKLVPIEKQSETAMKPFVADRAKTQLVVKTESKESPVMLSRKTSKGSVLDSGVETVKVGKLSDKPRESVTKKPQMENVLWNEPVVINAAKNSIKAKIKQPLSDKPVTLSAEHALFPVADIQKTKVQTKKAGTKSPLSVVDSDRLLRDIGVLHSADSNKQVYDSKTNKLKGYQHQQLYSDNRVSAHKLGGKTQTETLLNGTGKSGKDTVKLTAVSKVPTKKPVAMKSRGSVGDSSPVGAVKTKLPPRVHISSQLNSTVGIVVERPLKQFRTRNTSQPVASPITYSDHYSTIAVNENVLYVLNSTRSKPQSKTLKRPTDVSRPELNQSNSQLLVKVPLNKVVNPLSNGRNPVVNAATKESKKQAIQRNNTSQQHEHVVLKNDQCVVANPCRNSGTCQTSAAGVVVCVCRQGFGGPTCETAVNPCRPSPCLNDANCSVTLTPVSTQDNNGLLSDKNNIDFLCSCLSGFTGRRCEMRLNPCDSRPCLHGGRCSVIDESTYPKTTVTLFRCECAKTFVGPLCEVQLRPVSSPSSSSTHQPPQSGCSTFGRDECQNGGTCHSSLSSDGSSRCHCQLGFIGKRCEIRAVQCTNLLSCLNGGTCLQASRGNEISPYFRCVCPPRFAGRLCEKVRQRPLIGCDSSPCSLTDTSATCREVDDGVTGGRGFSCTCSPGRSGELCEIGGDPCGLWDAKRNNPCRNSGICMPLPGDGLYRCLCSSHYVGRHCDIAVVRCGTTICLNGGVCSSSNMSSSIGDHGQDMRTVVCRCPVGYIGRHCERHTDPCRSGPCINGGLCRPANNREGFSCICAEPFFGWHCELTTNGSSSASDDVSDSEQESLAQVSPKTETLIVDMRGDGDCHTEVYCLNGGSCFRTTAGRRVCVCQRGFGGERCENGRDSCSSNPCLNGASCYNSPSATFRCVCPTGYTGSRCDVGPTICAAGSTRPCQNNGACRPARNTAGYECICPLGYGGLACELRDPCLDRPCRNGAECFVLPATDLIPLFAGSSSSVMSSFQCRCPAGFSGQYCEVDGTSRLKSSERSACSSVPCQGGATCRLSTSRDGFVCVCPPGVKGKTCERDSRNDCRRAPCRHGGVCFDRPGGFECSCPDGYRGITCEVKLFEDPCDSHPCSNGGRCKMISVESFSCSCPALFSGIHCTERRKLCESGEIAGPCLEHQICAEDPADFDSGYICVDKNLQTQTGVYQWKFVDHAGRNDDVNVDATRDAAKEETHGVPEEKTRHKKKLSNAHQETKHSKEVTVTAETRKSSNRNTVFGYGLLLSASLLVFIVLFFIIWDKFRVPIDDYGSGSKGYRSLPTNGSTPTSSRPQTPQQAASSHRGPNTADNFQQSNSWMEEEAGEPSSVLSPSMSTRLSSSITLPSAERRSSILFPQKPSTFSLLRTRSLASIPEETDFNNTNTTVLSSSSCSRMIQIEDSKVDCQLIADHVDVSHMHLSDDSSGFNIDAGESVSWAANNDDSPALGAHNANNSSGNMNNNTSMTRLSRRDAVLARLSEATNNSSLQFWLTSLPTGIVTRTATLLSGRWPSAIVVEPRSMMEETERSLSSHVVVDRQLPPPVVLDTGGFQTADLFSVTDDSCQLISRDTRPPRRVGPFNYAVSGTR